MSVKKQITKSTAKATSAAQSDESQALAAVGKESAKAGGAPISPKRNVKVKANLPPKPSTGAIPVNPEEANLFSSTAKKKKSYSEAGIKGAVKARVKSSSESGVGSGVGSGVKSGVKPAAKSSPTKKTSSSESPEPSARVLDSQVAFEGPLFRVLRDHLVEPDGREAHRDVIRHNGSVVILAVNHDKKGGKKKKKKNPWIVIERQYRHAAGQYLWELPAGKLEVGEDPLAGAKRELGEETGYSAEEWSPLVEYYASPGFLGEAMKIFLAEGLVAGDAHPEEDEHIDFRLVRLSEILEMVDEGRIIDGKTLTSVLLYARQLGVKPPKE